MEFRNAKTKTGIFSSLITLLVVGLLIFAGPANALSLTLTAPSNTTPFQGNLIYIAGSADFTTQRANSAILKVNGEDYCGFNVNNGSAIDGCAGVNVQVTNSSATYGYGYGYGYGAGIINYNISLDTSFFPMGINSVVLEINSVNSVSQSFNITVPMTIVNGTAENATLINVTNEWRLSVAEEADEVNEVIIPANTQITPTDSNETINISKLSTLVATATGLDNIKGVLQFGIPNLGLTFSNPITLKIFVGTDLNGQTLTVHRSPSNSSGWTQDGLVNTTCLVALGICEFQTTKASYFTASQPSTTTSTTTSGVGGYCTTEWAVSEWSECTNGFQTRTVSYPANFCAPKDVKPATTQACTSSNENTVDEENVENNETTDRNSLFTGLVIGEFLSKPTNVIGLIVVLLLIVLAFVYVARKKKAAVEVISQEKVSKKTANTKKKKK